MALAAVGAEYSTDEAIQFTPTNGKWIPEILKL
jgi:hypothetical protein